MTRALVRYIPPPKGPIMPVQVCTHCKRPTGAHYRVTRFDASSNEKGSVVVCSLLCLLNWVYAYSTAQGLQLAQGVSNAFQQVVEAFRGLKK